MLCHKMNYDKAVSYAQNGSPEGSVGVVFILIATRVYHCLRGSAAFVEISSSSELAKNKEDVHTRTSLRSGGCRQHHALLGIIDLGHIDSTGKNSS